MRREAAEEELRHAIRDARPHTASLARRSAEQGQQGQQGRQGRQGVSEQGVAEAVWETRVVRGSTLEGERFLVEFCPPHGWLVLPAEGEAESGAGGLARAAPGNQEAFESLHALLSARSTLYCASFQRAAGVDGAAGPEIGIC